MSNARDKANIPSLNFSSTGIDDNATSTAITIDSSEDVTLTGKLLSGFNKDIDIRDGVGDVSGRLRSISSGANAFALECDPDNTGASSSMSFRMDGSETMRITSSGNLIIGDTTEADARTGKLKVRNDVDYSSTEFEDDATIIVQNETNNNSASIVFHSNNASGSSKRSGIIGGFIKDTDTAIGFYGSIENKTTSSNPDVIINSSGKVGIGTASPVTPLNVIGGSDLGIEVSDTSSGGNGVITIKGNATNGGSYLQFGDTDDDNVGRVYYTHNDNAMKFNTNDAERMRIANNGYIGMGTTTTTYALNISNGAGNMRIKTTDSANVANASTSLLEYHGTDNRAGYVGFVGGDMVIHTDTYSAGDIKLQTNGSERMRIDSSGRVGIGETSMDALLVIKGDSDESTTPSIRLKDGSDTREAWITNTAGDLILSAGGNDNVAHTQLRMLNGNLMTFKTDNSERMRINSTGHVLVGTTNESPAVNNVNGAVIKRAGYASEFTGEGGLALQINRKANNGTLVSFRQDGTQEGSISVSGTTVSYNGFTGTHWSRFTDNSTPTILRGTVLESLDEMCDWYNLEFDVNEQDDDGNDVTYTKKIPHVLTDTQSVGDIITYNHNGTDYQATIVKETDIKHMMSKVSDTVDAKNVYGVFVAYDLDGEGYNDFYVASVGSYVVRIKQGETIAKGDLLQSNGDGTAKVQTDDAVRSSSFAKVLSTTIIETYEDGSYLVPCSLNC